MLMSNRLLHERGSRTRGNVTRRRIMRLRWWRKGGLDGSIENDVVRASSCSNATFASTRARGRRRTGGCRFEDGVVAEALLHPSLPGQEIARFYGFGEA
jgi:hypothetical protein